MNSMERKTEDLSTMLKRLEAKNRRWDRIEAIGTAAILGAAALAMMYIGVWGYQTYKRVSQDHQQRISIENPQYAPATPKEE